MTTALAITLPGGLVLVIARLADGDEAYATKQGEYAGNEATGFSWLTANEVLVVTLAKSALADAFNVAALGLGA